MRAALVVLVLALLPALVVRADVPPSEAYVLHCSGCHGTDGAGRAEFVPDLREVGALLERPGGRAYLGRVPGVAQAPVGDAELATLLNWVLEEIAGRSDVRPLRGGRDPRASARTAPGSHCSAALTPAGACSHGSGDGLFTFISLIVSSKQ